MKKSCHKEAIENTLFMCQSVLKICFDAFDFTVNNRFKDYEIVFANCEEVQPRNVNATHIIKKL